MVWIRTNASSLIRLWCELCTMSSRPRYKRSLCWNPYRLATTVTSSLSQVDVGLHAEKELAVIALLTSRFVLGTGRECDTRAEPFTPTHPPLCTWTPCPLLRVVYISPLPCCSVTESGNPSTYRSLHAVELAF